MGKPLWACPCETPPNPSGKFSASAADENTRSFRTNPPPPFASSSTGRDTLTVTPSEGDGAGGWVAELDLPVVDGPGER